MLCVPFRSVVEFHFLCLSILLFVPFTSYYILYLFFFLLCSLIGVRMFRCVHAYMYTCVCVYMCQRSCVCIYVCLANNIVQCTCRLFDLKTLCFGLLLPLVCCLKQSVVNCLTDRADINVYAVPEHAIHDHFWLYLCPSVSRSFLFCFLSSAEFGLFVRLFVLLLIFSVASVFQVLLVNIQSNKCLVQ